MCITIQREKTSKYSKHDFFYDFNILGIGSMSSRNYSNTSHTRKGINYSKQNSLPNVCQPLTGQEVERRILQEGETSFALTQEDEAISAPPALSLSTINNATLLNNSTIAQKKHGGNQPPTKDHFN